MKAPSNWTNSHKRLLITKCEKMRTNLPRKIKASNGKQNISSTVKLFKQRLKTTQLLFREIKKQISDDLEPEIILETYQEFKKLIEQAEVLVDFMT